MDNFTFYNPTTLYFGKGQIFKIQQELPQFGQNVLLVYGGGSIKQNGIYDAVKAQLANAGANVVELAGVEPNPRLTTVQKGIQLVRENNVHLLLAVGGGSVIDCTKLIAAGASYKGNPWDIVTGKKKVEEALPFGTVLTIAATGSEMNATSVITNEATQEKLGWASKHVYPKFSILDPEYTFSVSKEQTVYGIVDMMSHVLEHYFHYTPHTDFQDKMCEGLLTTIIEHAPKLLNDLQNYKERETILYCGTMALNGFLNMGYNGDWATHNLEHAVSAVYDIPHGGGLAIIQPHWMDYVVEQQPSRFAQLACNVFHVQIAHKTELQIAKEGINALRAFWQSLGAPTALSDYNIDASKMDEMVNSAMTNGPYGNFFLLDTNDTRHILTAAL